MVTTQTQIRRDTAANLSAATPTTGELGYDTTNKRLVVGDGSTAGGIKHASAPDVQKQSFVAATVGGTANAITLTCSPVWGSYVTNSKITFKATSDSSSAVTLNVDGLGAKDAKYVLDNVLTAFDATTILKSGLYYEAVYDGTQFQVLGIGKTSSTPNGLVYLGAQTASNSATINFTSLITSTYDDYVVILDNIVPQSAGAILGMRTSTNNGSSYDTSGYVGIIQSIGSGGATVVANTDKFDITNGDTSTSTSLGISGEIKLYNVNSTTKRKMCISNTTYFDSGGTAIVRADMGGARDSTSDIDAIRFLFDTGNIVSGEFKLYGISKA